MPIPDFDREHGYLPVGVHEATWDEVAERYAPTFRRRQILAGLARVVAQLRARGVKEIWIDGSFVTDEQAPRDVDVVYAPQAGENPWTWGALSPIYRERMKIQDRVDLWPYPSPQSTTTGRAITILEFFQQKHGVPKGIVKLAEETGMIKNDRQLAASKATLEQLVQAAESAEGWEQQTYRDLAARVRGEIDEYLSVRDHRTSRFEINSIDDLPRALIKARIAAGLTQRQLAERLGVSEQMVQRDESRLYERASIARITDVIEALGYELLGCVAPQRS